MISSTTTPEYKKILIEKLLANDISLSQLVHLREMVDANDLSVIIQKIYDLNEKHIFELSAIDAMTLKFDRKKNEARNQRFDKKIKQGFRKLGDKNKQVILVEGDSWFNYPIILTDVIDRVCMEEDLAVCSIASGGDWLLNMLSAREYIEELSVLHPDWFLISAGGNDLVGSRRLATILKPEGDSKEFDNNEFTGYLLNSADTTFVPFEKEKFERGLDFLSKDFYALLMFFHLQYYFLIDGILRGGDKKSKFPDIRIITQGYDYPIPSFKKNFGLNILKWYIPFVRSFLGHGKWLKLPLQIRGIDKDADQQNILYAMIWLFNEMMIDMGKFFNEVRGLGDRVYHIDSRNSVGEKGWSDELHPRPRQFMKTGTAFVECIKQTTSPTYGHVYVVSKL